MITAPFLQAFGNTFLAVTQLALIVLGAWILADRKVIGVGVVKGLSDAAVIAFLPCLLFSNIIDTLNPGEPLWWMVPLIGVAMFLGCIAIATLAMADDLRGKRDLIALAALQNVAYLVLPIAQVLIPQQFDRFTLYISLYLLAHNPLFWSVGKFLATSHGATAAFTWRGLLTPPLIANVLALVLVFTGARAFIPQPVMAATRLVGSATVPVSIFVLGAALGGMVHQFRRHLSDAARVLAVKLIIIPLVVILILSATSLRQTDPVLALMLVLQGASAPAVNIMLQITTYGGNLEKSGTIILMGYVAALFTIPFWVALWQVMG